VAPPANIYDFNFLAPCPSSGLVISGEKDKVVPWASVGELAAKTKTQKGIKIEHTVIAGANHFFANELEEMKGLVGDYVDKRMVEILEAKREKE
jgi:uncharacterized protein